jgi:outer membrane lipoprotein-sorting protein
MNRLKASRSGCRTWRGQQLSHRCRWGRRAGVCLLVGFCLLVSACLRQRLTGEQVLTKAQQSLRRSQGYYAILEIDVDTDLIKDMLSVELWEEPPESLRLKVLASANAQLRGLEFVTDGTESKSYLPHANAVMVGPADSVRLPSVLETPVQSRSVWILEVEPSAARVVGVERSGGLVLYHVQADVGEHEAVQFWIDARDWLVRRVTYADTHLGSAEVIVRNLRPLNVPDSRFELEMPDGVPVTRVAEGESE